MWFIQVFIGCIVECRWFIEHICSDWSYTTRVYYTINVNLDQYNLNLNFIILFYSLHKFASRTLIVNRWQSIIRSETCIPFWKLISQFSFTIPNKTFRFYWIFGNFVCRRKCWLFLASNSLFNILNGTQFIDDTHTKTTHDKTFSCLRLQSILLPSSWWFCHLLDITLFSMKVFQLFAIAIC